MGLIIAIDGPGGSGKSTVSRLVGARLNLPHLDTGAYYRAAGLIALRAGTDLADGPALAREIGDHQLTVEGGRLFIDSVDLSMTIRTDAVTNAASRVSVHPEVRRIMVEIQREWVGKHGGSAVVEGRDIGTVVFPHAAVKVFLTAHPEMRARRRARETTADVGRTRSELVRRDQRDSTRAASPLQPASDAIELDTTHLKIEEVVDAILSRVEALND